MASSFTSLFLSIALAACGTAQEPVPVKSPQADAQRPQQQPQQQEAARNAVEEMLAKFREQGITVDAKARTVSIPAVMNDPPDPVEYLLISQRGKKHESVFVTKVRPSVLNGALLLLGLKQGTNVTYKDKVPPPSIEEIEQGADPFEVTPPKGDGLWMTVSWKAEDGTVREHGVEELVADLGAQQPVRGATWVYLGGRMASIYRNEPPVYVADFEGNLVSIPYMSPDNHLATMSHERCRDDQNWYLTEACPPAGTEVTFVFHREKPKVVSDREERLRAADKDAPQTRLPPNPEGPRAGR